MSILRADTIINAAGNGAPSFTHGASVSGVVTATSFSGAASGLTGDFAGNAAGLNGTPNITTHNINSTGVTTAISFSAASAGITTFTDTHTISTLNNTDLTLSPHGTGIVKTSSATMSTPVAIPDGAAWSISSSNVYTFAGGTINFPSDAVAGQCGIIYITGNVTAWGTASQWHFPGGTLPTAGDTKTNSVIPFYVHSSTAIKLGSVTGEIS